MTRDITGSALGPGEGGIGDFFPENSKYFRRLKNDNLFSGKWIKYFRRLREMNQMQFILHSFPYKVYFSSEDEVIL